MMYYKCIANTHYIT